MGIGGGLEHMKSVDSTTRLAATLCAIVVGGCAATPPRGPEPPPVETHVFAYSARGQSPAQLDRDRYECHVWAVGESHFDPSAPGVPERYRVRVEPRAGEATVAGAVTGAVLGAAVASPHDEGAGAVVGALAGAAIGAAADQNREQAARQRTDRRTADYSAAANGYRRAVSACLEGRGYTIR
jgi:hypothetical protein